MVKPETKATLREIAGSGEIEDAYLNSVYMWLISAAAELGEHDNEMQNDCCDEQHVARLHRAVCMIHTAHNSLTKYVNDFTGPLRKQAEHVIKTFYEIRYAHEDMMPGCEDDPMTFGARNKTV